MAKRHDAGQQRKGARERERERDEEKDGKDTYEGTIGGTLGRARMSFMADICGQF